MSTSNCFHSSRHCMRQNTPTACRKMRSVPSDLVYPTKVERRRSRLSRSNGTETKSIHREILPFRQQVKTNNKSNLIRYSNNAHYRSTLPRRPLKMSSKTSSSFARSLLFCNRCKEDRACAETIPVESSGGLEANRTRGPLWNRVDARRDGRFVARSRPSSFSIFRDFTISARYDKRRTEPGADSR